MAHDGQGGALRGIPLLDDLESLTRDSLPPLEAALERATEALREAVTIDGRVSGAALEERQCATHGLAWLATYVEALRQMQAWAERLIEADGFGEVERLIHQIA